MANDLTSVRSKLSGPAYPASVSLSASVAGAVEQSRRSSRQRTRRLALAGGARSPLPLWLQSPGRGFRIRVPQRHSRRESGASCRADTATGSAPWCCCDYRERRNREGATAPFCAWAGEIADSGAGSSSDCGHASADHSGACNKHPAGRDVIATSIRERAASRAPPAQETAALVAALRSLRLRAPLTLRRLLKHSLARSSRGTSAQYAVTTQA